MPRIPKPIFENDALVVIDKPSRWLTTPARAGAADPRPCLGVELQKDLGQQIYPVHRLDFEVSGLVIFAKTTEAHRTAQLWFEDARVLKTYRARTIRAPGWPDEWAEWTSRLAKGKRRAFRADHGKASVTRARVVTVGESSLSWDVMPITGRPHQLRFELSDRGWPILGDVLYGGPAAEVDSSGTSADGICLRAWRLDFTAIANRLGLPAELLLDADAN